MLVTWAEPAVVGPSVIVAGASPRWHALTTVVRDIAAAAHIGCGDYDPPAYLHITLAYGIAEGPDQPIQDAIEEAKAAPLPAETFHEIVWCAVHQDRSKGTYTFDPIARTPLL